MNDRFEQDIRQRLALAALAIFAASIGGAIALGEQDLAKILMGGALANATTVLGFYFGSSSGSQKKDDTIREASAALAQSSPTASPSP